ncbi:TA system antitoxin ParD family protein [Phytobacter diazotrophicus]|uniref:TA system antitoxin ParD family protein n=1 Tax=Phytobacter diazotrophicus TaxID=395631 RepID=UPI0030767076
MAATTIRLDADFVEDVKAHADAQSRSVPKQIEYWAKIGRIAEDNPELPFSLINEILLAKSEIENGRLTRYVRRKDRSGK